MSDLATPSRPVLPPEALDDRIAFVGTSGSGKTYAAKGLVEHLVGQDARVCIVDPLGVWWGLRAGADGTPDGGLPVLVLGGLRGDVPLAEGNGTGLGHLVAAHQLRCVVDLSELGSGAARERFMAHFLDALHEANREPLHLVLDEADLWAPQKPLPSGLRLLGRVEEIVRRGRVRGFIPWLITQRPAVLHKNVLSQADVLVAMRLTSAQDRAALGAWIEGQADKADARDILAALPRLHPGKGWVWAPGHGLLQQTTFPMIGTFDSSRTPRRGERSRDARLAPMDAAGVAAALRGAETTTGQHADAGPEWRGRIAELEEQVARQARGMAELRDENRALHAAIKAAAGYLAPLAVEGGILDVRQIPPPATIEGEVVRPTPKAPVARPARLNGEANGDLGSLHAAARALLLVLVAHAPARLTWHQAATLAGLKARGGHFNSGRQQLRAGGLVEDGDGPASATAAGIALAGDAPPAATTAAELLALWCDKLPSPAPEMLRALAAAGETFTAASDLAARLEKQPRGGHWNHGMSLLRNNGLVETQAGRLRAVAALRPHG